MLKVFVVSIVFILLLSPGIFADAVNQDQQFNVVTSNIGTLVGSGTGAMSSVNLVPIANIQQVSDGSGNIKFVQIGVASLVQGGSAAGLCGIYGFNQGASASGYQWQTSPGYFSLGLQGQNMGASFSQSVINVGGLGSAVGFQNFIGGGNQITLTPYGVKADVECLGVGLFDSIGGHASSVISRSLSIERTSRLR